MRSRRVRTIAPSNNAYVRRAASSVWLPWASGLLALVLIAGTAVVFGGHVGGGTAVPQVALDDRRSDTIGAAQRVRRALDAGLRDLEQLAASLTLAPGTTDDQVKRFVERYKRYRSAYVIAADGSILARAGRPPHPNAAPRQVNRAGMADAVELDRVPVVVQHAPVRLPGGRDAVLVGEYEPAYLRNALQTARPITAWVVNAKGQVICSSAGFIAFQKLENDALRRAAGAARTASGVVVAGGGQAGPQIVAHAPVVGPGQASALSWGVVTVRMVRTVELPQTRARDQAVMFGMVLLIVTVGVFGWLCVRWLIPLRHLVADAQRIADGDLRHRAQIRRYDELGLIGRAIERLRADAGRRSA